MPRTRPRRAHRPSVSVRVARVAVPLALVATGATGVVASAVGSDAQVAVPAAASAPADVAAVREQPVSRGAARTADPSPTATPTPSATHAATATSRARGEHTEPTADQLAAHPKITRTLWSTDDLNLRADPDKGADVVGEVPAGTRLPVTATVRDGYRLVAVKGHGRWVTAKYLSKTKPDPATSVGVSRAACAKGSAMEQGLTPDAILVHRTVCARYPQVSSFGGLRGGEGFHATGQAVDCMIADSTVGWQIARWVRAHARELGVSEVIYSQHIWTVQRSGEGWRSMSDRGSRTANHDDHVHVSVYGHRATA